MSVWPHSEGRCQPSESRNGDDGRGLEEAGRSGASGHCSEQTSWWRWLSRYPDLRRVQLVLSMNPGQPHSHAHTESG